MLPIRFGELEDVQFTPYREVKRCLSPRFWSIFASMWSPTLELTPWAKKLFTCVNATPSDVGFG